MEDVVLTVFEDFVFGFIFTELVEQKTMSAESVEWMEEKLQEIFARDQGDEIFYFCA